LGQQSEADPHADVGKGLWVLVVSPEMGGLVAHDLELAVAADLHLGARGRLAIGKLLDDEALLGKLGLVDGSLARGGGHVSMKQRFVVTHLKMSPKE